jgi:hypothetical protein
MDVHGTERRARPGCGAETGLVALAIVEDLDELEQVGTGGVAGYEPDAGVAAGVGDLPLQGRPEGLHRGVVGAVAGRTERQLQSGVVGGHDEVERTRPSPPLSEWNTTPVTSPPRTAAAMHNAALATAESWCSLIAKPGRRREARSSTVAR